MAFYRTQHELYCGVALHARRMYTCVIDSAVPVVFGLNTNRCLKQPDFHRKVERDFIEKRHAATRKMEASNENQQG